MLRSFPFCWVHPSLSQNPPVHSSDFSWAYPSQMRHSRDLSRKLNSSKPFPETNLFMLSLNSKSCGVYIIVFKISLAMLFYRFLKNNLYNPCFFFSVDYFFIWEWGIFLCLILSSFLLSDPAKPLFAPDVCKQPFLCCMF